jgi:hypothetical protein
MRLAIMQPYLFPYLGYFQLLRACDTFVFYDDVTFIKQGWVNRNRLWTAQGPQFFTLPILSVSSFVPIRETLISERPAGWRGKLRKTFEQSYRKAPHFEEVWALMGPLFDDPEPHVGQIAQRSVRLVAGYLGIEPRWVDSSVGYGNSELHAQDRVLDICRREGADEYVNMIGGQTLYDRGDFARAGVTLRFLTPELPAYPQGKGEFAPGLSILDVLFFNSREQARALLDRFQLS